MNSAREELNHPLLLRCSPPYRRFIVGSSVVASALDAKMRLLRGSLCVQDSESAAASLDFDPFTLLDIGDSEDLWVTALTLYTHEGPDYTGSGQKLSRGVILIK